MRALAITICVAAIQIWPVGSSACCDMCFDVAPTPLDTMMKAGVRTDADAIAAVMLNTDHDVHLRWKAAHALGQLCDSDAIPDLLAALSDSEALVRGGAAEALRFMPDAQLVQPLCRTAMNDPDLGPRHGAVIALSAIKTTDATNCLVAVIVNEHEQVKVRLLATTLVSQQLEEREGLEGLIPTLNDPDPSVKGEVAIILSHVYESEPQLIESLRITGTLHDAALDPKIKPHVLIPVIEKLEQLTGRDFLGGVDPLQVMTDSGAREFVNLRIEAWATENRSQIHAGE